MLSIIILIECRPKPVEHIYAWEWEWHFNKLTAWFRDRDWYREQNWYNIRQWVLVPDPVSDQCEHFCMIYNEPSIPVPVPVSVPFPCSVNVLLDLLRMTGTWCSFDLQFDGTVAFSKHTIQFFSRIWDISTMCSGTRCQCISPASFHPFQWFPLEYQWRLFPLPDPAEQPLKMIVLHRFF